MRRSNKKKRIPPVSDFGLIGLGVMGQNLARNVASRGYHVSVYNRHFEKTQDFLHEFEQEGFSGFEALTSFVRSLHRPRKIMIMVKAGTAVDAVLESLLPHLDDGDIILDGGNSHYKNTQRRVIDLKKKKIHFIGCGVSGGEVGALNGPSLMPGGSSESWKSVKKLLEDISAKDFSGGPCVTYVGDNGAGHYVKMVHNGIEYGIMQLMAETYDALHTVYGMSSGDIANVFEKFNRGKLGSYLFEIAVPVLSKGCKKGEKESCLIYKVLDKAGNKGTGKWASMDALDRGIAVPTITQAVYARYISSEKDVRTGLEKKYTHKHKKPTLSQKKFINLLESALYSSIFSTFAQGFDLIQKTAVEEKWKVDLAEVSRIWEGGCIIRAKLLKVLHTGYVAHKSQDVHVFQLPTVQPIMKKHIPALREFVSLGVATGIPLAGFSSALYYFEAMTKEQLPANVIQGLRDYFGAHTYERVDKKGVFHTDWEE